MYGLRKRHLGATSHMRWDFRDTSCLLSLQLKSGAVTISLTSRPELTRLKSLTVKNWDYKPEQAEQLLCLQFLGNLQVHYFSTVV